MWLFATVRLHGSRAKSLLQISALFQLTGLSTTATMMIYEPLLRIETRWSCSKDFLTSWKVTTCAQLENFTAGMPPSGLSRTWTNTYPWALLFIAQFIGSTCSQIFIAHIKQLSLAVKSNYFDPQSNFFIAKQKPAIKSHHIVNDLPETRRDFTATINQEFLP